MTTTSPPLDIVTIILITLFVIFISTYFTCIIVSIIIGIRNSKYVCGCCGREITRSEVIKQKRERERSGVMK